MKRLLIVSPHFPPVNAPDAQRVRLSLPYYERHGWRPCVLTVRSEDQPDPADQTLLQTIPEVRVERVGALPLRWTSRVGIGNIGLRALPQLERAGARLIREEPIDLVLFSTTMFMTLPLGRVWKYRLGVPFVIDLQDPWFSTYYDDKPRAERPPKYALARAAHRRLEAWTMREVSGLITVSDGYTDTLRQRYPWLRADMCATIPFGGDTRDFEVAERRFPAEGPNRTPPWVGRSVGRGGPDLAAAARILFRALKQARAAGAPPTRIECIGTSYASDARAAETLRPVAVAEGLDAEVTESTARVAYLDGLSRLRSADFLVLLGSDDPQYSASKAYPYLFARRPILAILHARSPLVDMFRGTHASVVVFRDRADLDEPVSHAVRELLSLLNKLPFEPKVDSAALEPYTAAHLAAEQCGRFDRAMQEARSGR